MADRYIPEHRRNQFKANKTFKPDELRRRREEQQVEIRKAKREENLAKRRGIAGRDGTQTAAPGAALGASVDSDDEGGTIESQVCLNPSRKDRTHSFGIGISLFALHYLPSRAHAAGGLLNTSAPTVETHVRDLLDSRLLMLCCTEHMADFLVVFSLTPSYLRWWKGCSRTRLINRFKLRRNFGSSCRKSEILQLRKSSKPALSAASSSFSDHPTHLSSSRQHGL